MSDKIISIESDDLGTLYFASSTYELQVGGMTKMSGESVKFEQALQTVKNVAQKVVNEIRSIEMMPDEVECKIGVTFDAEAGIVFAKVGTECNLELTLKWTKKEKAKKSTN